MLRARFCVKVAGGGSLAYRPAPSPRPPARSAAQRGGPNELACSGRAERRQHRIMRPAAGLRDSQSLSAQHVLPPPPPRLTALAVPQLHLLEGSPSSQWLDSCTRTLQTWRGARESSALVAPMLRPLVSTSRCPFQRPRGPRTMATGSGRMSQSIARLSLWQDSASERRLISLGAAAAGQF